ncbi:MAG: ester cyclase [Dehalococcoidia bacterium]
MSAEANKDLVRRYFAAIDTRPDDPAVLNEFIAEDFVDHSPSPGCSPDLAGLKQAFQMFATGSPGLHVIEDILAEGDKVVTRVTGSGTHTGDLFGIPATGRAFRSEGIAIRRIREGKIVEHWSQVDLLGVMQQLGVIPAPAPE